MERRKKPGITSKTFNSTNKNSKFFFNKDLNQLVFEWVGSEIGVFGHRDSQTPVFFLSLKDEAKCRHLLEDLFNTIFIDRSTAAVVDDNRIPRIVFPSWLLGLLRAFHIDLPEPFYMIQDGYLYLSNSAEALGMCKKETDTGKLLVKTDEWKKIDILVNNAGLAVGLEKFYEYNMEDVDRMVDTNIKGFTYI